MKRTIVLVAMVAMVLATCLVSPARASILVQYTFNGNSGAPTTVGTGVVASNFSDGDGSLNLDSSPSYFTFPVQNPPGVAAPPSAYKTFAELQRLVPFHAPDLTAANKQFFAFDIAASNYSLTLNNLSFLASHEFNSGGRDDDVLFTVYVDTHSNFSSPTYVYQTYITNITANYFVPLSGIVSDSIPPKLYFRIYLNDGGTYSGPEKVRVDNVTLVGTSVPAPEPATMCIWAVGAGLALVVGGVRKRFGIA